MAKSHGVQGLTRLAGKTVVFQGRFSFGQQARLEAMAEAHHGRIATDLSKSVDYLVLPVAASGKTVQKQAMSLNAKGAQIQVMDADTFGKFLELTPEEALAIIRGGRRNAEQFQTFGHGLIYMSVASPPIKFTFKDESFEGCDLSGFHFDSVHFDRCVFTECRLHETRFGTATDCDFSRVDAISSTFANVSGSRFTSAKLSEATFIESIAQADFTNADLTEATLGLPYFSARSPDTAVVFRKAVLRSTTGSQCLLPNADFAGADLTGAILNGAQLPDANFRQAVLRDAVMVGCHLARADFSGAKLRGANLANADLTDTNFAGADLTDCNLRGATMAPSQLSNVKRHPPTPKTAGTMGPALQELDAIAGHARQIQIRFRLRLPKNPSDDCVALNTAGMKHGWGVQLPASFAHQGPFHGAFAKTIADNLLLLGNILSQHPVQYETVEVSSTKSPKGGQELRDLVLRSIAEAFAQPLPDADQLKAATKAYRQEQAKAQAAQRQRYEQAREKVVQQQANAKKKIAAKIAKEVGQVNDIATFLKALELRIEAPKIKKATQMLKASGFQLFNDRTDQLLTGVVKSQTDPDLVYACRIGQDGQYACCTQNLNVCGGLRGSICKHLLVLIIGLVKAGELDPATIDAWIAKTHNTKPELDKESMGGIFIKYKGAEAGEVDWRPTQTMPEDYYAL